MTAEQHLVGRERERALLGEVLTGRRRAPAFVLGEAGIGKTRLIEAAAGIAASEGVLVLQGRCLPLSTSLPLLPVVDVIRECAAADGGETLGSALAESREFVRDAVDRLLSAAPPPLDDTDRAASWGCQQTFEAVRQALAAVAGQRPLAVVIEDVHWADAMSVDMIEYLLSSGHGGGFAVVVSARDHGSAYTTSAGAALLERSVQYANAIRVKLGPLTVGEVGDQIAALTGEAADPVFAGAIHARSQGNPFFTEQLVAHLSGPTDVTDVEPPMPDGLAELLLSRVAGLGHPGEEIVAVLAVAARPLEEIDLSAACGVDAEAIRAGLRAIRARGLLRARDARYQLRHVLVEQAVSADLLPSQRRELHARLGSIIGTWRGGQFAAEAAEHFARAEIGEEELRARTRAADHAQRIFAWTDAARHWRRALELYGPDVPREGDHELAWQIHSELYDVLEALNRIDEMLELAQDAFAHLLPGSTARQASQLYRRLGEVRGITSPHAGLHLLQKALEACADAGPCVERLDALRHTEALLRHAGRYRDGEQVLDDAILVAHQIGQSDAYLRLIGMRAWYRMAAGDDEAATALLAEMSGLVSEVTSPSTVVSAAVIATDVLLKSGRLDAVPAAATAALDLATARGLDDYFMTWVLRSNVVEALVESGRVGAVSTVFGADLQPTRAAHVAAATAAQLDMITGRLAEATLRWQDIERQEVGSISFRIELALVRVELELWTSDPHHALERAVRVIEDARNTDESAYCGPLLVLAARACADLAETGRAQRDATQLDRALAQLTTLVELRDALKLDPFQPGPMRVNAAAVRTSWEAELHRASGNSAPETWVNASAAWQAQGRPHRAAYAMLRQVEDLLRDHSRSAEAREALPRAAELAREHEPLTRAIEELARRARIGLETRHPTHIAAVDESPRSNPYELTERELAVLELVAAGKTNAQIGKQLFISTKTASVHVSNILRKLDVATRAHAAAVAQRAGIIS